MRERIDKLRAAITSNQFADVGQAFTECQEAITRLSKSIGAIESKLELVPPIDVAVLGPSRHGKSTLLNALVACDLLPTSDIKPCTASILKMTWAPEWTVKVKFVPKDQLVNDWRLAVEDAEDELSQQQSRSPDGQINEDPRFVRNVLQRFVQLFRVDPDLPPVDLLSEVKQATIPPETARLLGQEADVRRTDVDGMRSAIAKYLSTSDVYWTIVASCEILGPFEDWHPSLSVVDLPGTNDSDPQRTIVTNSARESANAVAVVTSDSNIGPDIESWLRHSSVLANFLEASSKRRQRLFIIRTKLDSYHPEIDETQLDGLTEEEEAEVYWNAVEEYKTEQTKSYRSMLRDIASPKLPHGDDEASREKRVELLSRIDEIPVFYLSALAHEVFEGRYAAGRKTKRQLSEYFDDSIERTGVPDLRSFLRQVAANYLAENFFDDLEHELESEARHLARVFRKSIATVRAEVAGGRDALEKVVNDVRGELLPWLNSVVNRLGSTLKDQIENGATGIRQRLIQTERMSERRFDDKLNLWGNYHWASLRAAGRKNGSHVTNRGQCIDFAEDVCSVLIDDIIVAWAHYRDDLVEDQIDSTTNDLAEKLHERLATFRTFSDVPEVVGAIDQVTEQLFGITHQQRLELLRIVQEKIKELESIRRPAYEIAQEELAVLYQKVGLESGSGCSFRMGQHVENEAPPAIRRIRRRINALVLDSVVDLADSCTTALAAFGTYASNRIDSAVSHVSTESQKRNEQDMHAKLDVANRAIALLPC